MSRLELGKRLLVESAGVRSLFAESLTALNALLIALRDGFLSNSLERQVVLSRAARHVQEADRYMSAFAWMESDSGNSTDHITWRHLLREQGQLTTEELLLHCHDHTSQTIVSSCDLPWWQKMLTFAFLIPFPIIIAALAGILCCVIRFSAESLGQQEDAREADETSYRRLCDKLAETRGILDEHSSELSKLLYTYSLMQSKKSCNAPIYPNGPIDIGTHKLLTDAMGAVVWAIRERNVGITMHRQAQVLNFILGASGDTAEERLRNAAFREFKFPNHDPDLIRKELGGIVIPVEYNLTAEEAAQYVRCFFPEACITGKFDFRDRLRRIEKGDNPTQFLDAGTRARKSGDHSLHDFFSIPPIDGNQWSEIMCKTFKHLWMPPPVTILPWSATCDDSRIHEIETNMESFTVAAKMAEDSSARGRNRQLLTFCQRAIPLGGRGNIRVSPDHWARIPLSSEARRLLGDLRQSFTTDQDTRCQFQHVADTICRGCRLRSLCAYHCNLCNLAIRMYLPWFIRQDEVLNESMDLLHDILYHQLIYLTKPPTAAFVIYPHYRLLHDASDRAGPRTRAEKVMVSHNALQFYNVRRKCVCNDGAHVRSELKGRPDVFELPELAAEGFRFMNRYPATDRPLDVSLDDIIEGEPYETCPHAPLTEAEIAEIGKVKEFVDSEPEVDKLDTYTDALLTEDEYHLGASYKVTDVHMSSDEEEEFSSLIKRDGKSLLHNIQRNVSTPIDINSTTLIVREPLSIEEAHFYLSELKRLIAETIVPLNH